MGDLGLERGDLLVGVVEGLLILEGFGFSLGEVAVDDRQQFATRILGPLVFLGVIAGDPVPHIVDVGLVGLGEVGGGYPEFGFDDPGLVRVLGGHGDAGGYPLVALVDLGAEGA